MTYSLEFDDDAKKEWDKLDGSIRKKFADKLKERRENPRVPSAKLSGMDDCYKIKLRNDGYRLVYRVEDDTVVIAVIAVGKRGKNLVYKKAHKRLK
jgi:mRNA interferase RelE/StbE